MKSMKYIVFDYDFPIIFPTWQDHKDIASKFKNYKVTSAGMISIVEGKIQCYGESVSLGVKSSLFDATLIGRIIVDE